MDLAELTVLAAAAALRRGEVSAEAYAEALLGRCRKAAPLNAFIHHDATAVRAAAKDADRRRAAGGKLGPLHGVPLAFKDNLDTAGIATTGGTPGLRANRPQRNAPVVETLIAAGALMLGKTNMHELAFGVTNNNAGFGPARNPYDPARIPGGSSGGTGAAIAARAAPGGIGTDTGGSVRIPAALCGITGFRPSLGRWSQAGIVPISHTRDTAGPMARSVADCALLDGLVTGGPTTIPAADPRGLRVGLPRRYFWEGLDGELGAILEGVLARLRDAGIVLVEGDIPEVGTLDAAASFPIALHEVVIDLGRYLAEHDLGLAFADLAAAAASADVKGLLQSLIGGGAMPEAVYRAAMDKHRPALQETYRRYFRDRDVAAVIFPTTPLPAARIGEDETVLVNGVAVPTFPTYIRNTDPASIAGLPGLSLPAGQTASGLPVGIEIDGPAGGDQRLLAIGAALEPLLPRLPAPRLE